jgi:hypothetical protein
MDKAHELPVTLHTARCGPQASETTLNIVSVQVLVFTSTPRIVGRCFVNSAAMQAFCWTIGAAIMTINMSLIFEFAEQILPDTVLMRLGLGLLVVAYLVFVGYLIISPSRCVAAAFASNSPSGSAKMKHPLHIWVLERWDLGLCGAAWTGVWRKRVGGGGGGALTMHQRAFLWV